MNESKHLELYLSSNIKRQIGKLIHVFFLIFSVLSHVVLINSPRLLVIIRFLELVECIVVILQVYDI